MGKISEWIMQAFGVQPKEDVLKVRFGEHKTEAVKEQLQQNSENEDSSQKDCMECRVVGTILPLLGIPYVVWLYPKYVSDYIGSKKIFYNLYCMVLPIAFGYVAYCRAFEIGIFDKEKASIPIDVRLSEEIAYIKEFVGIKQKDKETDSEKADT